MSLLFTMKFSSARQFKFVLNYFQLFKMKVVTAKCIIWNTCSKATKTHWIQLQLFIFYTLVCLQKNIQGRLLPIRVFYADGHYLNNRVFLSRGYRLIVAPRKANVPNEKRSFKGKWTSNFQGVTIRLIVPRHDHFIVFVVYQLIFFRLPVQKSYFFFFGWKPFKSNVKFESRKQTRTHLIQFQLFIFYKPACL